MARTTKAKTKAAEAKIEELEVEAHKHETATFQLIGSAPLILNRMAEKAKRDLLYPTPISKRPKGTLKHEPLTEYQDSVHRRLLTEKGPTRLIFPASALKSVLGTASLESDGVTKAGVGRNTWIDGFYISIWGEPQLLMSVVRSAGMNKTPDIRTRAILPVWCAEIAITYITPRFNVRVISNLLHNGGMTCGLGDWRQEKGSGSNGRYTLCHPNDPRFKAVQESGGTEVQDKALKEPGFFDYDSGELFGWFYEEVHRRGEDKRLKNQAPLEAVLAKRALAAGQIESVLDAGQEYVELSEARIRRANGGGRKPRAPKKKVN